MLKVGSGASAPPFLVMDVIAAANARQAALPPGAPHVIRMEVGQPGTGAPAGAVAAAQRALGSGASLGYTEALGLPSLRARIAAHGRDWYGVDVDPARIAVTMGASGAFPLAFLAAFDRGDRVAMAAPYYPPYRNIVAALGLQPLVIETGPDTRYQPTVAMLERLDPLPDGLIVASPATRPAPCCTRTNWARSRAGATRNGVRLVSDEIYHGLQYGQDIATAAAFSPSAIVVNSFSKYFSMTGWRIGWMVLPADLVRPVECLAQNMFDLRPPHLAGRGGGGVRLPCGAAGQRRPLPPVPRPAAARAAPGRVRPAGRGGGRILPVCRRERTHQRQRPFCARMLAEAGVAASSGVDFDAARGHRTVRFSYCGPEADMAEAARRLRHFAG